MYINNLRVSKRATTRQKGSILASHLSQASPPYGTLRKLRAPASRCINNGPQCILIAVPSSGLWPTMANAYITSTEQKHMFHEMKLADLAVLVKNPEALKRNPRPLNKRYAATASSVTSEQGDGGDDDGGALVLEALTEITTC
ncbi:hypothetical protein H0H93_008562 [Arthromyces matolae]|nr:hypothetical protein H0H93_008562 [Arthromyces matolae]